MTAAEDHVEKKGGKKKKKKKKKMDDDDEDLNAMLAALRAEYIGKVPPGEASKAEEAPKEDAKKIKTNGKETAEEKGDDEDANELGFEVVEDDGEVGGTVKTAAQKKKDKKMKKKIKEKEEGEANKKKKQN